MSSTQRLSATSASAYAFWGPTDEEIEAMHTVSPERGRALKRYLATREDNLPWLFISERQAQLTRQAVNYIVRVAGETAKLGRIWPHMLHHSCGLLPGRQGH